MADADDVKVSRKPSARRSESQHQVAAGRSRPRREPELEADADAFRCGLTPFRTTQEF